MDGLSSEIDFSTSRFGAVVLSQNIASDPEQIAPKPRLAPESATLTRRSNPHPLEASQECLLHEVLEWPVHFVSKEASHGLEVAAK